MIGASGIQMVECSNCSGSLGLLAYCAYCAKSEQAHHCAGMERHLPRAEHASSIYSLKLCSVSCKGRGHRRNLSVHS